MKAGGGSVEGKGMGDRVGERQGRAGEDEDG